MQENKKTTDLINDENMIGQLFKIKNELLLIISLVKKNIKFLCIAAVFGGILGFSYAFSFKPVYTANLNFMIASNQGSSSLSSQLAGLAGVLGVGNSNIGSSLYRMAELTASDKIVTNAIFKNIEIDGSEDFIINHLIKLEELDKSWNKSEKTYMHNISFEEHIKDKVVRVLREIPITL